VEWSPWSQVNDAEYYFIGPGTHSFEVASRYQKAQGEWVEVPVAYYEFVLETAFVSKPIIEKGRSGRVSSQPIPNLKNLYSGSKALLVGVTKFKDQSLTPLPYIDKDISAVESTLKKSGFEVDILKGPITRDNIITKIEGMIAKAQKDDRLILYFSTHGFQDNIVKSKGYIASYDCLMNQPNVNCIELNFLEDILQRAIQKPVKHLLILLDACSSGLGIITKSPEYKEISIAVKPGAHMITAGLEDQEAQMDRRLKMSTFTYFFVEGLSGKADYTNDNVITLTELLVYVRYEVAKQTGGVQTPMMGRISGAGEMVFDLRPNTN
jgi:hypothetical protein